MGRQLRHQDIKPDMAIVQALLTNGKKFEVSAQIEIAKYYQLW